MVEYFSLLLTDLWLYFNVVCCDDLVMFGFSDCASFDLVACLVCWLFTRIGVLVICVGLFWVWAGFELGWLNLGFIDICCLLFDVLRLCCVGRVLCLLFFLLVC